MQSEKEACMMGRKDARYVQVFVAETAEFFKPVSSQRLTNMGLAISGKTNTQAAQPQLLRVAGIAA